MHKDRDDLSNVTPHSSGAPEAGGATTPGSTFGGGGLLASFLRFVARSARSVEAAVYRKLRDMDKAAGEISGARGRPNRVKEAGPSPA